MPMTRPRGRESGFGAPIALQERRADFFADLIGGGAIRTGRARRGRARRQAHRSPAVDHAGSEPAPAGARSPRLAGLCASRTECSRPHDRAQDIFPGRRSIGGRFPRLRWPHNDVQPWHLPQPERPRPASRPAFAAALRAFHEPSARVVTRPRTFAGASVRRINLSCHAAAWRRRSSCGRKGAPPQRQRFPLRGQRARAAGRVQLARKHHAGAPALRRTRSPTMGA